MAQMTECVASSISRWHGCKAEYYLLSCSTHSDLRWRDDRRGVPGVYSSEPATNKIYRRLKIEKKGTVSETQRASSRQKLNYLGAILAHELRF